MFECQLHSSSRASDDDDILPKESSARLLLLESLLSGLSNHAPTSQVVFLSSYLISLITDRVRVYSGVQL